MTDVVTDPAMTSAAHGDARAVSYQDVLRTGPGTLAGRYLRMFWQPVFRADDLASGEAKPIRIMGENFTLYRGETGTAHVVAQRCAHRGTQLSVGTIDGDSIRCLYHGWAYDGSGQCVDQPAEPEPFCDQVRIRACPTEEYLGCVFAYFGDDDAPPLPRFPEFEHPEFLLYVRVATWNFNFFAQLENSLDYVHPVYVHKQWGWQMPRVTATDIDAGIEARVEGAMDVPDRGFFNMPNVHEYRTPPQLWWGTSARSFARGWRVPVDDHHHLRLDVEVVPLTGADAAVYAEARAADEARRDRNPTDMVESILAGKESLNEIMKDPWSMPIYDLIDLQDQLAMTGLGPIADEPPPDRLGRMDVGVTRIRKLWLRELRALTEGRRVKRDWPRPEGFWRDLTDPSR